MEDHFYREYSFLILLRLSAVLRLIIIFFFFSRLQEEAITFCLKMSRFLALLYQFTLCHYCCSSPIHPFRFLPRFLLPPMCPNCQCCTPSINSSTVYVTCPCPFSVFNYFHNVHNFSLVPHPLVMFPVFISHVEHVAFHVALCYSQFLFQFYCLCPGLYFICHCRIPV